MNKDTKFYRVTANVVANYVKEKDLSDAQLGKKYMVPGGVIAHIRRTIYIMNGGK